MMSTGGDGTTFSVVVPSYNAAGTIGSAIRSVLGQTRSDFELIVVDDRSTDGSAAIIKSFVSDKRVTLIEREQNGGQSAARNTGIGRATGQYICLLDSDDVWLPRYLEAMAQTFEAHPRASVVYTDAWVLYDGICRILRRTAMETYRPPTIPRAPAEFLRALLEYGNFVYYSAAIRGSALRDIGGYNEALRGAPDYELWMRLAATGHTFVRCDEILAIYRRRPGQLTADPIWTERALTEIYQLVIDEYDVPGELRQLAARRADELLRRRAEEPDRRRPRLPLVSGLRGAFARLRWFYLRPPASVREAFPSLSEI